MSSVPNPELLDLGYEKFIKGMDAIVMGRTTFDIVRSFDIEWPYKIPVFVLSNSMKSMPEGFEDNAEILKGPLSEILEEIHKKGKAHEAL